MSSELETPPKKPIASRPELIRWMLAIGAVVAISLLYPYQKSNSFPFEYELNQNWRYDDLQAPFEFPILKTTERYQRGLEDPAFAAEHGHEGEYEAFHGGYFRLLWKWYSDLPWKRPVESVPA